MKKQMFRQGGAGLSGLLVWSVILMVAAVFGMRLFPMLTEKMSVDSALESVAQSANGATTKEELVSGLMRRFSVADVTRFTESDLHSQLKVGAVSGKPGRVMALTYDAKVPLFANFYLGMTYNKMVPLPGGAE